MPSFKTIRKLYKKARTPAARKRVLRKYGISKYDMRKAREAMQEKRATTAKEAILTREVERRGGGELFYNEPTTTTKVDLAGFQSELDTVGNQSQYWRPEYQRQFNLSMTQPSIRSQIMPRDYVSEVVVSRQTTPYEFRSKYTGSGKIKKSAYQQSDVEFKKYLELRDKPMSISKTEIRIPKLEAMGHLFGAYAGGIVGRGAAWTNVGQMAWEYPVVTGGALALGYSKFTTGVTTKGLPSMLGAMTPLLTERIEENPAKFFGEVTFDVAAFYGLSKGAKAVKKKFYDPFKRKIEFKSAITESKKSMSQFQKDFGSFKYKKGRGFMTKEGTRQLQLKPTYEERSLSELKSIEGGYKMAASTEYPKQIKVIAIYDNIKPSETLVFKKGKWLVTGYEDDIMRLIKSPMKKTFFSKDVGLYGATQYTIPEFKPMRMPFDKELAQLVKADLISPKKPISTLSKLKLGRKISLKFMGKKGTQTLIPLTKLKPSATSIMTEDYFKTFGSEYFKSPITLTSTSLIPKVAVATDKTGLLGVATASITLSKQKTDQDLRFGVVTLPTLKTEVIATQSVQTTQVTMPKLDIRLALKSITPTYTTPSLIQTPTYKPPRTPPIKTPPIKIKMPLLKFPNLKLGFGRRKGTKTKRPFQYQPSLVGILSGKRARKPKVLTGIEVRPISI